MKKLLVFFILTLSVFNSLYAITDYEKGYLQGYEDALTGKKNAVQQDSNVDTGVWLLKRYVDETGAVKPNGYIGTNWQKGSYSTTTISNGKLAWYFIIDKQGVAFKIFENADNVAVKGTGSDTDKYTLVIQKHNGEVFSFSGTNFSDRIWFLEDKHEIESLLNSGECKISITSDSRPTKYNLGIFDGTGFEAAYIQLYGKNF